MSSKGTRKSQTAAISEEKDKRQTDSPVKEMKKKIAANAEKEKQASDKADKPEKVDKTAEKSDKGAEKTHHEKDKTPSTPDKLQKTDKTAEKQDKNAQKPAEKNAQKLDKSIEKTVEKKTEKIAENKTEKLIEKKSEPEKKEEAKVEANRKDKPEKAVKQNGKGGEQANGDTVSDSSEEDLALVIDDQDELFPELAYDSSDGDEDAAPSRSLTRRSQVKVTKTPETPRPASFKEDDSKEKAAKKEDPLATDRKLRSADSPKPEAKKPEQTAQKKVDSPKKDKTIDLTEDEKKKDKTIDLTEDEKKIVEKKLEMEVMVEIESMEGEPRSMKTRARVSPYTRSAKHDLTASSVTANYTGNNTTMEMDITESSIVEEPNLDDSYLRGLRSIKGRSSYKQLKELSLKHTLNRSARSGAGANISLPLIEAARPTGTVVGRKRKPDSEDSIESAQEAVEGSDVTAEDELLYAHSKRMRLFDRFSVPFRGFSSRRAAEIVGINTDLPLSAPVSTSGFDPETLKPEPLTALPTATHDARDAKRCIVM